jgi:hypothetical protein
MLTNDNLATIQSALDTLAAYAPRSLGNTVCPPAEFKTLHITTGVRYTRKAGYRWETPIFTAKCDIDCLYCYAEGHTRLTAIRNLFKRIANSASWNARSLRVPLALSEPTKAAKQAKQERAERKVQANAEALRRRAREWYAELDRAATAVEAERAATTIIGPAPEFRAVDSHDDSKQVQIGGYSRIVCTNSLGSAPHTEKNAGAESGTEPIFRALLGLTTEQKIVALANALLAAQTTIYRVEEDGNPIIRAVLPNYHPHLGTCTVLNL